MGAVLEVERSRTPFTVFEREVDGVSTVLSVLFASVITSADRRAERTVACVVGRQCLLKREDLCWSEQGRGEKVKV